MRAFGRRVDLVVPSSARARLGRRLNDLLSREVTATVDCTPPPSQGLVLYRTLNSLP